MLNSLNSDPNGLYDNSLNPNSSRVRDNQFKAEEDPSATAQINMERLPKTVIPTRGIERFGYFDPSKSKTLARKLPEIPEKSNLDDIDNSSAVHNDKGLVRIPANLLDLKATLTTLDISKNKFEYFPLEIVQLQALTTLKLDHNRIKCIPGEVVKLSHLQVFSISHNLIQTLPSNFAKLGSLKELNIEYNILESFNQELTDLTGLESLNILQNRLVNFPCSFKTLGNLTKFTFEWFRYANPPQNAYLNGKDDEHTLKKLRNKCAELSNRNVKNFSFYEFLEFFSYDKVNLKPKNAKSRTMLHIAAVNEDISVLRYLITNVPDLLDMVDRDNMTALCLSLVKERFRGASYLVKHGANPTKGGGILGSPLHIATKKLNFPIVKEILRLGENPNKTDSEGSTPLHIAITAMTEGQAKAKPIVECLLEYGANPNAKNRENWTPLHLAVRKKSPPTLTWILSYNLEIEEIHGKGEIFQINKKGGIYNWTAMHIAAYCESPELVMKLGNAGAEMFKRSINGYTPKKVMNRPGLTLKMVQKYERAWIKKHVFLKKKPDHESLGLQQIEGLNNIKEIRNASKNKFGENYMINMSYVHGLPTEVSGYNLKSRRRVDAPFMTSEPILSKKTEDSLEISPETGVNTPEESMNTSEVDILDFCSELNEDVNVGVNPDQERSCFMRKNTMQAKTRPSFHQREIVENEENKIVKKKSQENSEQTEFAVDLSKYEKALRSEESFGYGYCKEELKCFKEKVISEKVALSEKLKVFTALRILHKVVLEHIFQVYNVPTTKEEFPLYILKESVQKSRVRTYQKKDDCKEMIHFYEMIPNLLISLFMSLSNECTENSVIKTKICQMLGDTKHFSAIDFLKNVISNPLEEVPVIKEAQRVYKDLKERLEAESVFAKEKENKRDWSRIKSRQFGPTPYTKVDFSPVKKLDKTM